MCVLARNLEDVATVMERFKSMVQAAKPGVVIKRMVFDSDPVYTSEECRSCWSSAEVKYGAVGVPQQSGRAHSGQATMYERARAMVAAKHLPTTYWSFALKELSYLSWLIPHGHNTMSPYEMINGVPPDVSRLRTFGSVVVSLKQVSEQGGKFEPRGNIGILVGHVLDEKGSYWVYDSKTKKLRSRNDVRVLEDISVKMEPIVEDDAMYDVTGGDEFDAELKKVYDRAAMSVEVEEQLQPDDDYDVCLIITLETDKESVRKYADKGQFPGRRGLKDPKAREVLMRAMYEEYNALNSFNMFAIIGEDVDFPEDYFLVGLSDIAKVSTVPNSTDLKVKWRTVLRGDQVPKNLVPKTFSPTVQAGTFKFVTFLSQLLNMGVKKMDVVSAYPHARIDYGVDRPTQFVVPLPSELFGENAGTRTVYAVVDGALYGLPDAGRLYNELSDKVILQMEGMNRSVLDPSMYYGFYEKDGKEERLIVPVNVDDFAVMSTNGALSEEFRRHVQEKLNLKDLGELKSYCSIEITKGDGKVMMSQAKYVNELKEKFGCDKVRKVPITFQDTKEEGGVVPLKLLQEVMGCIRYAADNTRPDLLFAGSVIMSDFSGKNAKRAMEYLTSTIEMGIVYTVPGNAATENLTFEYMSDASHGIQPHGYSYFGGAEFPMIGESRLNGATNAICGRISSMSPQSSYEAEVYALTETVKMAVNRIAVCAELKIVIRTPFNVYVDNKAMLDMTETVKMTRKSRAMAYKWEFIREQVRKGRITVKWIPGVLNVADIFTKPLPAREFAEHRDRLLGLSERVVTVEAQSEVRVRNQGVLHEEGVSNGALLCDVFEAGRVSSVSKRGCRRE
jgi:hypothetical protein